MPIATQGGLCAGDIRHAGAGGSTGVGGGSNLVAETGLAWRPPRRVGWRDSRRILLAGELLDADEARCIGPVDAQVTPEDLLPAARRWAASCQAGRRSPSLLPSVCSPSRRARSTICRIASSTYRSSSWPTKTSPRGGQRSSSGGCRFRSQSTEPPSPGLHALLEAVCARTVTGSSGGRRGSLRGRRPGPKVRASPRSAKADNPCEASENWIHSKCGGDRSGRGCHRIVPRLARGLSWYPIWNTLPKTVHSETVHRHRPAVADATAVGGGRRARAPAATSIYLVRWDSRLPMEAQRGGD